MFNIYSLNQNEIQDLSERHELGEDHHRLLNEEQFYLLLDELRLNNNKDFSQKMFLIFGFNNNGFVNYYELFHRIFQFWMIRICQKLHKKSPLAHTKSGQNKSTSSKPLSLFSFY